MTAATLTINLSAEDLDLIVHLPEQVETLVTTARGGMDGILQGTDGTNALSGLLGGLATLADDARQAPGIDQLLEPLQGLLAELPAGALADVEQVTSAIEEVLRLFGPLREAVAAGGLEQGVQAAIETALEASSHLLTQNDELTQMTRASSTSSSGCSATC